MNKSFGIIIGVIAIIVIAWLVIAQGNNVSPTVTQNPGTETPTDQPGTGSQQAGSPSVITNPKAVPTDTTVVLTGTVNPNGAFTTYWYEYGTTRDMGNKTSSQGIGSGFSTLPAPTYFTGLTKNTTYYFRLHAENRHGSVSNGQYSFTTTEGFAPPVGGTPKIQTLKVSGVSRTSADLNGEVTPNMAATQYWFEYGKTADLGNTTALVSAGTGNEKTSVSASISSLDPLTTYYFRLNAQNQFGTVTGTTLNFETAGPPAATAPTVSTSNPNAVGTSTVALRGTVNSNRAETKYWFEYSINALSDTASIKTTGETTIAAGSNMVSVSANLSDLIPNTTYNYRVVAENSAGTVRGDTVSFKTK